MNRAQFLNLLAGVASLVACAPACAYIDMTEVDPRTRARIVREKLRMSAMERMSGDGESSSFGSHSSSCGSQEIGVIESKGRQTPREVIVYAPNAINIVSAKCPR